MKLSDLTHEAKISAANVLDLAANALHPSVRLGVTGLSRAGKTGFITALLNTLINGGPPPFFRALRPGRRPGALGRRARRQGVFYPAPRQYVEQGRPPAVVSRLCRREADRRAAGA